MSWNSDIFESSLEESREEPPAKYEEKITQRRWRGGTPASKLCEAGLTIGKRIPAPSNDWALTIALSLTDKNFSALVLTVLINAAD